MNAIETQPHKQRTYSNVNSERSAWRSLKLGLLGKCPSCGVGHMFHKYLKVNDACTHCSEELHHHQADDAPPYFTILILGHILVPLLISFESAYTPPMWVHAAIWIPLTIVSTLITLHVVKGAVVAMQWAFRMHGFGESKQD